MGATARSDELRMVSVNDDYAPDRGVSRVRVLVVDDDWNSLRSLERTARRAGLDVVAKTNHGEHALDLARVLAPDVALIDWDMPHFGGALTARLLRHYAPKVKPILLVDEGAAHDRFARSRDRFVYISKASDADSLRRFVLALAASRSRRASEPVGASAL